MLLEQFGLNFSLISQAEQIIFFLAYLERRAIDLSKPTTFKVPKKPGSAKKKGKNVKVTSDALEKLKKLGLV